MGEILEGLVRVAEEVHHGRPQEDAAGELGAEGEERLVPLQEVGGYAGEKGRKEDHDEAPDLGEDQRLRSEIRLDAPGGVGVRIVVAAATATVGGDGDGEG